MVKKPWAKAPVFVGLFCRAKALRSLRKNNNFLKQEQRLLQSKNGDRFKARTTTFQGNNDAG
jgi:hypothetical protein